MYHNSNYFARIIQNLPKSNDTFTETLQMSLTRKQKQPQPFINTAVKTPHFANPVPVYLLSGSEH